ncbi:MAG: DMT family transporter [Alphaproteobacteria bacterium]
MFENLSTNQKGMLVGLMGYTSFAFSDTIQKFVAPHYPALQIACINAALASLVLLFFSRSLGGWRGYNTAGEMWFHGVRILLNILLNILMLYSFTILSLANIYAMIFAKPFFAALLAVMFYKERVTFGRWAAIFVGFIGVLVILQPTPESFQVELLIPLFCAFLVAIMFILSRSLNEASPFVMGFYPLLGTFLAALPFAIFGTPDMEQLFQHGNWELQQSRDIIWGHVPLFVTGGFLIAGGILGVSLAFRLANAGAVAPFLYTEMIWGIIFGYLIFGDTPNFITLLGSAIIISSGLYLILVERWRRPMVAAAPHEAIPRPLRISSPRPWNFFDPVPEQDNAKREG